MNSRRVYYVLSGLITALLVAIAGSAYAINSMMEKQSSTLVEAKAQVNSLNNQQVQLNQAKKEVATYTPLYNIARSIVPQNKDQAEAVRQIVNLAAANGITLDSISFPPSTLGGTSVTQTPSQATGAPVTPGSNPALSQLQKVPTIPGVYELTINVTTSTEQPASYSNMISFLSSLEQNRLTALVSSISITPVNNSTNYFSFQLTLNIYIKPGS